MSVIESWKNRFAEYCIIPSRTGAPTAMHMPTGLLVHSGIDPMAEAREIAEANHRPDASVTAILGGGLGYLAESMLDIQGKGHTVVVIEPDVDLLSLSYSVRPNSVYAKLSRIAIIRVTSPTDMARRCEDIPGSANLIIAPHFDRLAASEHSALAGFLRILRSERASRIVYDPLVAGNAEVNKSRLTLLPNILNVYSNDDRPILVIGAGPSLDQCVNIVRELRPSVMVVAASGAVPSLHARGIEPDWVIAMEGKDILLRDLSTLTTRTRIIAFPSTHPVVLSAHMPKAFAGVRADGPGLETRGGSSLIPALDFALRVSSADVVLIGADLSNSGGHYAKESNRETTASMNVQMDPPKFLAMRTGLERVLDKKNMKRNVYHVLEHGEILNGAKRLLPQHLGRILSRMMESEETRER